MLCFQKSITYSEKNYAQCVLWRKYYSNPIISLFLVILRFIFSGDVNGHSSSNGFSLRKSIYARCSDRASGYLSFPVIVATRILMYLGKRVCITCCCNNCTLLSPTFCEVTLRYQMNLLHNDKLPVIQTYTIVCSVPTVLLFVSASFVCKTKYILYFR